MYNSINFRVKTSVDVDKKRLLELFFSDWIDRFSNNEATFEKSSQIYCKKNLVDVYRVEFVNAHDVLILKLKGIPSEFQNYLEIIK